MVKTLLDLKKTTEELSEALFRLEEHNRILERGVREKTHHLETASRQLMVSEDRYRTIFENTGTAMLIIDEGFSILQVNSQWEKLFGYSREETEGRGWEEFIQEDQVEKVKAYCRMRRDNPDSVSKTYEYPGKHKSGGVRDILLTVSLIPGPGRIIASLIDITERKQAERLVRYMAYHDSLTSLPNRKLFQDRLSQELSRASRKKEMFAVMFLDLDDYKLVNDTYGHEVGDKLICEVANRLKANLRESDMASRMGGDEFTILLTDINNQDDASIIARKIFNALSSPVAIGDHRIVVSVSLGISIYPSDGITAGELIRKADNAMYLAKKMGKNNYKFYVENIN